MQTVLPIQGMSCGHCVKAAKEALEAVAGVSNVEVQLTPGQATIEHDETVTREALVTAITEEGYEVPA